MITAIIGVIFTAAGFGNGNVLMPTLPANVISINFDLSLFGDFLEDSDNCSEIFLTL